ncbi:MAG: C13 family peptidase [Pseudomonadota bacterium]|nr:C13 family peptidase [Pseudomonadota bacterium]
MRHQLAQLRTNLAAGARVAFLLRVDRLLFRFGLPQLLMLFVLSAVLDFGNDWLRYGPDAYFSIFGAGSEMFSAGLMLLLIAVLALAFRRHDLAVALPVIVLASLPFVQLLHMLQDVANRWFPAAVRIVGDLDLLFTTWLVIVLIRCVAVGLGTPRTRQWGRPILGGLLLATPLWIASTLAPNEPWWKQPAVHAGADPRYPNPASEPVLAAQAALLDSALSELEDERPDTTDLYFVAFGGYATEDVFRKDVEKAQHIMDQRWDTAGRSIVLVNNPRTLLERPMATVTNLRETLSEIAGAMNTEEDVVMIYIASHGAPQEIAVTLPPLELDAITPPVLRKLLDDSGITWRIVIVSACFGGSFIPALQDDHTMVITAAQADRSSFGCGFRSEGTYFGEAFFDQGLAKSDSITAAFDVARKRITEREAEEGVSPPSNPQIYIGGAMREKLKDLQRGASGKGPRQMVCDRCNDLTRARVSPQNAPQPLSQS